MRNALFALVLAVSPATAAQYSFDLKPENTKIQWTLGDALHTVHGMFNLKSGQINFDSDTGQAFGEVIVDVTSGNSDNRERDRRMHTKVLESARYPEAVFTPDRLDGKIAVPGDSTVKLHGTFRIHDTSHEITMDVQTKATGERIEVKIAFDIPYVEWGMKDPSNFLLKVNKTVAVSIQTTATLHGGQ